MPAQGERILIVDDEAQIRRLLSLSLTRQGYVANTVEDGEAALTALSSSTYDLVLLDLGLPDHDGVELCREIRTWSSVPIIVVSVRSQDREKVRALDAGADDFVTKPFSIEELLARIRASLRRQGGEVRPASLTLGALTIDFGRRSLNRGSENIHLTPTEYALLRILATNAGRVVTHRELLRQTRGPAYVEETPLLRVHMVGLRQKMGVPAGEPGYVATEPGVGYRLVDG